MRAHSETVLRSFYGFHLEAGTGPIMNPFPLGRTRRGGRANAHHNPMEPYRDQKSGLYRPKVPRRVPRSVPDEEFNEIFAKLGSHRDRALVAFYVSTGARASELLSVTQGRVHPGRQVIAVVRKGSGEVQEVPASTDAFVWLRLYQAETEGLVPRGPPPAAVVDAAQAVPAAELPCRAPDVRAGRRGARVRRHVARAAAHGGLPDGRGPVAPMTDVQAVLGHARLTTTQIYTTPRQEDVIRTGPGPSCGAGPPGR